MKLTKKRLMQIINEELDEARIAEMDDARGAEIARQQSMDDLAMQSGDWYGDKEEPVDQDIIAALGALQRLLPKMTEKGDEINTIIASVRALGGLAP